MRVQIFRGELKIVSVKMKKKGIKQRPKPKNIERNARRNRRIGHVKEAIRSTWQKLECAQCGLIEPLVFYGQHRNITLQKMYEGNKSLRQLRRKIERNPVLCLNHATLRREQNEDRSS